jgi:hypothetical protein
VIDDRGLSPFSASGQIIASVNCRRADNYHAMALAPSDSLERSLSGVIFQLQFAQDLLKSRRSDIAAVLIPL